MKDMIKRLVVFTIVILVVIACTWRLTMLSLGIVVNDDTCYITSYGQVDAYDYTPNF